MVDRQDIDALLISALYGELTPADEVLLTAHLESHPADRTALRDLTHARTVIRWGIEHLEAQERENMEQAKKAKRTAPARKPNPVAEKLKQPV